MPAADVVRIDVGDGELAVVRWLGRPGTPVVFGVHGLTANAWCWSAVARHLDGELGLVAVDLRGRGGSHAAPGPYGIRRHADDLSAVIERLSAAPAVVVGHSMGAFVALECAERHPASVARLVLIEGGPPVDVPPDVDARTALHDIVGPAIDRLQTVWPDRVSYRTMWSEHPAFRADGLTPEIERYVLSDLTPCDGGFCSIVDQSAVWTDGVELVADLEIRSALERYAAPAIVLRAEAGVLGEPPPIIASEWQDRLPRHDWRTVAGTNHYTVLIGEAGAAAIAGAVRDAVGTA